VTGRGSIPVLFVCTGNAARSQMAEAVLGERGGADFAAFSAGTKPKGVHPLTVRTLAEVGIDWPGGRVASATAPGRCPGQVVPRVVPAVHPGLRPGR
jgi:protein-tyrosine-phosphatase